MLNQLRYYFGFDSFKYGQEKVVEKVMQRQSAAAIFPTGAGKSLCYQLPAMLLPEMTLVVSPLLSLMKDQLDFLLTHNIPAARLDSSLTREEYNDILEKAKRGKLKILMISVERFKNERFRYNLQRMKISLLVVDEAHCVSEWGHNFRPEYLKLPIYQKEYAIPQVLLLTATATEDVRTDMCRKFQVPRENIVVTGFYRHNLFLQVTPLAESKKNAHLLQTIAAEPKAPTIVYVTLQKTAEKIADFLCAQGISARHYHAGMKNEERELIQNRFMNGELNCVVATIAFGMGIDKKNIRRVTHYDLPKTIENYSQEIGRSGRDGENSRCELLANLDNINVLENFVYGDTPAKQSICRLLQQIKNNDDFLWEIKSLSLSNELDIRILPLKTLLVYLDMEGIIKPKYSYFEEYSFKYRLQPQDIIARFQGERREFLAAVFRHVWTKKVWSYIDMEGVIRDYGADRDRIVKALDYFDEKQWIELRSQQLVDVYEISSRAFQVDKFGDKLYNLFKSKEEQEIRRIHEMVGFFESDSCLSKGLAGYFGEHLTDARCGHCTWCQNGKVTIKQTTELQPLANFDIEKLAGEFSQVAKECFSKRNVAKFLCGIYSPAFSRLKVRRLKNFGILEKYPFLNVQSQVENWLRRQF